MSKYIFNKDIDRIEAIRWTGENFAEVVNFVNPNAYVALYEGDVMHIHYRGNNTEYIVYRGEYIIKRHNSSILTMNFRAFHTLFEEE